MEFEIFQVMKLWTEGEIYNFIKVWLTALSSLSFCYFASKLLSSKNGTPSLLLFVAAVPVVFLNLILPLQLHSMHLGGSTAFFLAWLCNFKIVLFSFGRGPLSADSAHRSLGSFLAIASLPIKIQQKAVNFDPNKENPDQNGLNPVWSYLLKISLIPLFLRVYNYSDYLHPWLILATYCIHLYIGLELILALVGGLARFLLGVELEPQFNEPYLSTSLQDFWGRRWNIMVTRILRPSVYEPVLRISSRVIGLKWASLPAIFSTFTVSALMHELIFFYLGRKRPTGEISCFFLLHGVCLIAEIVVKKHVINGRIRIPRIIATPLTVGFVMVTGFWLFFPEFVRCHAMERAFEEYSAIADFVRDMVRASIFKK